MFKPCVRINFPRTEHLANYLLMENSQSQDSVFPAKKPLGVVLIEAGLVSIHQVELALQEQETSTERIGEILSRHGWIKQQTVDFFAEKWSKVLEEKKKKPLPYYLNKAGLLDKEQINTILELQKLKPEKVRFHNLVSEQGYLSQKTVDFFLACLYNIHKPRQISVYQPYEILRKYIQGQRSFTRVDLSKSSLAGLSLKEIKLDGSNLREADLTRVNLSESSLIRVNLNLSNLNKAILTRANCSNSFFTGANLREAHLEQANFSGTILKGADFQEAYLAKVDFSGADLTAAKLNLNYPYEVFYDESTIFDSGIKSQLVGWKKK